MKLLLDTETFLFLCSAPQRLSSVVTAALNDASNQLYLSHASFWEIAWKCRTGDLSLPDSPRSWVMEQLRLRCIEEAPLGPDLFFLGAELSSPWPDLFDRLLAVQAIDGGFYLVTAETGLSELGARILW